MPRGWLGGGGGNFLGGDAGGGITDPGGLLYPGIDPESVVGGGGDKLNDYLNVVSQMRGAPYRFWSNGGDGMTNQSIAEVLANGESCSGMFVYAFREVGMTPPFVGTYDAAALLTEPFDSSKTYPIGTFLVTTAGDEGHIAMVTGSGNQLTQALHSTGITDQYTIEDTMGFGDADLQFVSTGTFADLGSSNTAGSMAETAVDTVAGMAQAIALGVADALLRFIRALYAYVILRPLDFAGGFWWELTRRFLGYLKARAARPGAGASRWELPGADIPESQSSDETKKEGQAFSDEDKKRIWFMLFCFSSYYLAFGRDGDGNYHLDKAIGGAGNLFNRDLWGKKNYNNRARITAGVRGVTVARRRARVTSRKPAAATRRSSVREDGAVRKSAPVVGTKRVAKGNGETEIERRATTDGSGARVRRRDPGTGRFVKPAGDGGGKKAAQKEVGRGKAQRTKNGEDKDESG